MAQRQRIMGKEGDGQRAEGRDGTDLQGCMQQIKGLEVAQRTPACTISSAHRSAFACTTHSAHRSTFASTTHSAHLHAALTVRTAHTCMQH
eukprot:16795-Pelagomonas_calceolata.AAC.11